MSHDRGFGPPWTTWWRRLEATRAWQRGCWSLASGRSRARKLCSEGRARRGEDGKASVTLTRAREAVRRPGDDSKAVAVVEVALELGEERRRAGTSVVRIGRGP
jgi:hypothetical protein